MSRREHPDILPEIKASADQILQTLGMETSDDGTVYFQIHEEHIKDLQPDNQQAPTVGSEQLTKDLSRDWLAFTGLPKTNPDFTKTCSTTGSPTEADSLRMTRYMFNYLKQKGVPGQRALNFIRSYSQTPSYKMNHLLISIIIGYQSLGYHAKPNTTYTYRYEDGEIYMDLEISFFSLEANNSIPATIQFTLKFDDSNNNEPKWILCHLRASPIGQLFINDAHACSVAISEQEKARARHEATKQNQNATQEEKESAKSKSEQADSIAKYAAVRALTKNINPERELHEIQQTLHSIKLHGRNPDLEKNAKESMERKLSHHRSRFKGYLRFLRAINANHLPPEKKHETRLHQLLQRTYLAQPLKKIQTSIMGSNGDLVEAEETPDQINNLEPWKTHIQANTDQNMGALIVSFTGPDPDAWESTRETISEPDQNHHHTRVTLKHKHLDHPLIIDTVYQPSDDFSETTIKNVLTHTHRLDQLQILGLDFPKLAQLGWNMSLLPEEQLCEHVAHELEKTRATDGTPEQHVASILAELDHNIISSSHYDVNHTYINLAAWSDHYYYIHEWDPKLNAIHNQVIDYVNRRIALPVEDRQDLLQDLKTSLETFNPATEAPKGLLFVDTYYELHSQITVETEHLEKFFTPRTQFRTNTSAPKSHYSDQDTSDSLFTIDNDFDNDPIPENSPTTPTPTIELGYSPEKDSQLANPVIQSNAFEYRIKAKHGINPRDFKRAAAFCKQWPNHTTQTSIRAHAQWLTLFKKWESIYNIYRHLNVTEEKHVILFSKLRELDAALRDFANLSPASNFRTEKLDSITKQCQHLETNSGELLPDTILAMLTTISEEAKNQIKIDSSEERHLYHLPSPYDKEKAIDDYTQPSKLEGLAEIALRSSPNKLEGRERLARSEKFLEKKKKDFTNLKKRLKDYLKKKVGHMGLHLDENTDFENGYPTYNAFFPGDAKPPKRSDAIKIYRCFMMLNAIEAFERAEKSKNITEKPTLADYQALLNFIYEVKLHNSLEKSFFQGNELGKTLEKVFQGYKVRHLIKNAQFSSEMLRQLAHREKDLLEGYPYRNSITPNFIYDWEEKLHNSIEYKQQQLQNEATQHTQTYLTEFTKNPITNPAKATDFAKDALANFDAQFKDRVSEFYKAKEADLLRYQTVITVFKAGTLQCRFRTAEELANHIASFKEQLWFSKLSKSAVDENADSAKGIEIDFFKLHCILLNKNGLEIDNFQYRYNLLSNAIEKDIITSVSNLKHMIEMLLPDLKKPQERGMADVNAPARNACIKRLSTQLILKLVLANDTPAEELAKHAQVQCLLQTLNLDNDSKTANTLIEELQAALRAETPVAADIDPNTPSTSEAPAGGDEPNTAKTPEKTFPFESLDYTRFRDRDRDRKTIKAMTGDSRQAMFAPSAVEPIDAGHAAASKHSAGGPTRDTSSPGDTEPGNAEGPPKAIPSAGP